MAEINLFFIFISSIGFDLLIGDPRFIVHPVQVIGLYIRKTSNFFIHNFNNNKRILFLGGFIIACSSIGISFLSGKLIEIIFLRSKSNLVFGILIFLGLSSCLASKSLTLSVKEISNILSEDKLDDKSEKLVREKVQRIVSRDISSSSVEHLLRSSGESLTENSVDGIFGPLFWIFIGMIFMKFSIYLPGPLSLGFSYKAISTLDSMIGYKYDQYKYLGFISAKIEDYSTFLPSRLVLLTLPLVSSKIKKYFFIIKKSYLDGSMYDSPNSGISEAIFAYISNVRLGGKSIYNKRIVEKPIINPNGVCCSKEKINLICQLIYRLQFLWIIIFSIIFFNI